MYILTFIIEPEDTHCCIVVSVISYWRHSRHSPCLCSS